VENTFASGFTLRTLMQQIRAKTINLSEALQGTPCLVFRPLSENISPLFHTGESALSASGVHLRSQTDSINFQESKTHGYLDPAAIIAPLWKSDRNAFAGMIVAGRSNTCDIRINSKEVSKTHALFKREDDKWFLTDNHSTNGTYLNSVKLIPGESYRLESNFEIQFSSIYAVFLTETGLESLCDLFEDQHHRAMTKRIKRPKHKCPGCGKNPYKEFSRSCADPTGCGLYKKGHRVVHRSFKKRVGEING